MKKDAVNIMKMKWQVEVVNPQLSLHTGNLKLIVHIYTCSELHCCSSDQKIPVLGLLRPKTMATRVKN